MTASLAAQLLGWIRKHQKELYTLKGKLDNTNLWTFFSDYRGCQHWIEERVVPEDKAGKAKVARSIEDVMVCLEGLYQNRADIPKHMLDDLKAFTEPNPSSFWDLLTSFNHVWHGVFSIRSFGEGWNSFSRSDGKFKIKLQKGVAEKFIPLKGFTHPGDKVSLFYQIGHYNRQMSEMMEEIRFHQKNTVNYFSDMDIVRAERARISRIAHRLGDELKCSYDQVITQRDIQLIRKYKEDFVNDILAVL